MPGNDVGNSLMSCGCLLMLIPIIVLLIIVFISFVSVLAGGG